MLLNGFCCENCGSMIQRKRSNSYRLNRDRSVCDRRNEVSLVQEKENCAYGRYCGELSYGASGCSPYRVRAFWRRKTVMSENDRHRSHCHQYTDGGTGGDGSCWSSSDCVT